MKKALIDHEFALIYGDVFFECAPVSQLVQIASVAL
jgi:hypothetical protein